MKRYSIVAIICIFLLGITFQAHAQERLSKERLVYTIANLLGIELPEEMEELSAEETYEVLSNALAEIGINIFIDTNPEDSVTYGDMAETMYGLLGGAQNKEIDEKIMYLSKNGYLPNKQEAETVELKEGMELLNNPDFTQVVAEAYSPADVLAEEPEAINFPAYSGPIIEEDVTNAG